VGVQVAGQNATLSQSPGDASILATVAAAVPAGAEVLVRTYSPLLPRSC